MIDMDGIYNPCRPNDRLLLGLKGSMSEFELGILRPLGRCCAGQGAPLGNYAFRYRSDISGTAIAALRLTLMSACRKRFALIFERFRRLRSARQALLSLAAGQMHFPRPSDGKKMVSFQWTAVRSNNIIRLLKNPFYAGAYVYGKSEKRTTVVDGRARKTYGRDKPFEQWGVIIRDHHLGKAPESSLVEADRHC